MHQGSKRDSSHKILCSFLGSSIWPEWTILAKWMVSCSFKTGKDHFQQKDDVSVLKIPHTQPNWENTGSFEKSSILYSRKQWWIQVTFALLEALQVLSWTNIDPWVMSTIFVVSRDREPYCRAKCRTSRAPRTHTVEIALNSENPGYVMNTECCSQVAGQANFVLVTPYRTCWWPAQEKLLQPLQKDFYFRPTRSDEHLNVTKCDMGVPGAMRDWH